MARKKLISISMAALLSINSLWNPSPVFNDSIVADVKTESQTGETEVVSDAEQVASGDYGLCDNAKDGAILHAWCWSFNSIKENLKDIAEAGYTTVQTCPANECLRGDNGGMSIWSENGQGKWEYHYQPTDWKIGNYQLGSRDDFIAMCEEADKYGVKIIVDVNPNHTTPNLGAVSRSLIDAAGGQDKLYHAEGFNDVSRWEERFYCTNGAVLGLPDVNTENPGFQKYYLNYLNDLIDCGVDGFRYDTAKHIGLPDDPQDDKTKQYGWKNNFWPVVLGNESVDGVSLHNKDQMFIYGEVLQSSGSRDGEYGKIFHLTGSSYGGVLREAIKNKDFSTGRISDWCHATPNKIVTWVESHDTYCNKHESAFLTDWDIRMCWAIVAARANGTPLFYSRPDGSNGSQGNYWGNNRLGAKGNDQFKDPQVAACNHFRNAMVGESEYLSNFGGNDCLVIERGTKGVVVINLGGAKSNIKLNKVADGTYTEQISGKEVKVSGGVLNYEVPAGSIAVVYNAQPVKKTPKVTASKASGTFQDAFTLTLTASNATKATYSVNGGEAVEFTGKATVKIGEGASVGDKITVKVTAEGEGEDFSETFTYNMTEAPEYKMMLRVKKSDFSSAPTLYLYTGEGTSAKEHNGAWPGTAMTADGDYYVYTSDSVESATAILVSGTWRSTEDLQPGLTVSGCMEYDKASNKFTAFTLPVKTKEPVKETEVPVKETEVPVKKTEKPVKETEAPTEKPDSTKVPVTTTPAKATPQPTDKPTEEPTITVSKENGTSFSTETMEIKITVPNGTKGTYSVDNGPEKSFTSSTIVEIGKGKIADSDVTLKVKAGGKTETYTYKKDFDPAKAIVKASAVLELKRMFEMVSDAVALNTAAESDAFYATNPNGVGKEATITIDGSFSDWSEDMLIAQGGAWDIANNFKGGHENCVLDDYALYAAWDNDNLYIGWQMVNTTDTWASSGDGPLSDGGRVLDVPLMLALNVGNRPAMTGKMANGKMIWDALDVNFETRVDNILLMSGKVGLGTPGFFIASDASGGASYDPEYCLSFKTEGISYKMAEGCLPKSIMMLKGATDVSDVHDKSKYTDAMTEGHDTKFDSFYEINIPLKTLGIDKSYIEENGIGVMQIATRGTSGIDCIPHDPSMLDNATGDCAVDPSTSHEKDDTDIITVPLAAVGNEKAGGEGGDITLSTKAPTKTDTPIEKTKAPAKETKAPEKTEPAKKTEEPTKTEESKETKQPEKTAMAKPTEVPVTTPKATPKATSKPASGPEYDGNFTVNFGADRSSPQYQTTALTLKAIPYGGSGDYTYEFKVDGITIQKESEKDYCQWNGTAGSHTIKVIVKDGEGAQITSEKSYNLESKAGIITEPPKLTAIPSVTASSSVDNSEKQEMPSENAGDKLSISTKLDKKSPQAAGTALALEITAKGGTAPYKYTITVEDSANNSNLLLSKSNSNCCLWLPVKAGTYKLYYTVEDSKGEKVTQSELFKISSCVSISKFTANKYTVRKGKKVRFTMAATSMVSSAKKIQYRITAVRSGKTAKTEIRKYSNARSYSWKPKKKGKYTVYLTAKDPKGNTKTVKLKKKITVK